MKRYYLKALGSVCYSDFGITYPQKLAVNLKELLKLSGAKNIRWGKQYGWNNQPKVISFRIDDKQLIRVNLNLVKLDLPLVVMDKTW